MAGDVDGGEAGVEVRADVRRVIERGGCGGGGGTTRSGDPCVPGFVESVHGAYCCAATHATCNTQRNL